MNENNSITRRKFVASTGMGVAGLAMVSPNELFAADKKLKVALVGTGIRGTSFWGRSILEKYSDRIEFVGLCDINEGRLKYGKKFIGGDPELFLNFDEMLGKTKPDLLIVTTMDSTHDEFIVKGLNAGINVLTEKPLTTDEKKCADILEAERNSDKSLIVTFNYRYNPHYTRLRELIKQKEIGDVVSVDFHWYLDIDHGASYFRRWHGLKDKGGSLLVHKSTHHFDLLNWWLDSDPVEVMAYGSLEHYGKNGPFRGKNCRSCEFTKECKYYFDVTKNQRLVDLYVDNEAYDGYYRDGCVYREEIDIYDKMSAQIRYANNVLVNYSLTTYSPYEGMRIAFNGQHGRIDAWDGIPWMKKDVKSDMSHHDLEMSQGDAANVVDYEEIYLMKNFGDYEHIKVPREKGGHGGGDKRLHDRIFVNPDAPDPLRHAAGSRDGALSILIGIAARKSIEEKRSVKISELTDLELHAMRPS